MNNKTIIFSFFLLVSSIISAQNAEKDIPLIPYPQKVEVRTGAFTLSSKTQLVLQDVGLFWQEAAYLQSLINSLVGQGLSAREGDNRIVITYSDKIAKSEGYELDIMPAQIQLLAADTKGMFYGIQTLWQLLEMSGNSEGGLTIPSMYISDYPAFDWRGSMIDVSRHFFSIEYLKKHIDRLAFYKMNKLHIHLTDDQGWRIEIKKYPELTGKGAWRTYNNQDSICMNLAKSNPDFEIDSRYIIKKGEKDLYGGYYTQDQLRDLIQYAAARHIEIIPEIDMPGHMMAAISTYPELTDGKIGWGELFSTPICPCKEGVYTFIENILDEVAAIFPSRYIHIGADEVDKITWKESELCKKLMQEENITDVEKLQSYFVHRVQDIARSKGKEIIVWDEALDGGINSDATVMYWRGWVGDSPRKAALNNNKVIMSPTNPLYFDYAPDKSSLHSIYNMNVVYENVPAEKSHLIQGAQANLWTEQIPSENRADFLLFPRLTALSERVWTNQNLYDSYSQRLITHFPVFDKLGIKYRLPDLSGFAMESVFTKEAFFNVKNPLPEMQVRYTTDGSVPNLHSSILDSPIKITEPIQLKFALFSPAGSKGDVYTVNYRRVSMPKAIKLNPKKLKQGLLCRFYDGLVKGTTEIKEQWDKEQQVASITVPKDFVTSAFALKYTGYINVPETGIYTFFLTCDDGGVLSLNNEVVVDNDGLHSAIEKSGQAALAKGYNAFQLNFVEGGGGFTLRLQYSFNGSEPKDIPDSWFAY